MKIQLKDNQVPNEHRPTHKTGFLGLFGKRVDTIDWAKEEIRLTTEMLDEGRQVVDRELRKEAKTLQATTNAASPPVKAEDEGRDEFDSAEKQDNDDTTEQPLQRTQTVGLARKAAGQITHGVQDTLGVVGGAVNRAGGQIGNAAQAVGRAGGQLGKGAVGVVKTRILHQTGKESYPPLNSAFVTFNKQISAHFAVQALTHHEPYRMSELDLPSFIVLLMHL